MIVGAFFILFFHIILRRDGQMARSNGRCCRSCKHRRNRSTRSTHGPRQHGPTCAGPRTSSPPTAASLPGDALFRLPGAKKASSTPGDTLFHLPGAEKASSAPGDAIFCLPGAKQGSGAPGIPTRAFRSPGAAGTWLRRNSVPAAFGVLHSGPSHRLLRHRFAITCIRRAPPSARVRGWTRPPEPVPARSARRNVMPDLSS